MMVGTLAATGQVIAVELRDGYVSPNTDNVGFIEMCRKLLPIGTTLRRVRIDAAGYQHQVIDYLTSHKKEFLIRAAMNESIAKQIGASSEQDWQLLRLRDGKLLATPMGRSLPSHDVSQRPCARTRRATHLKETGYQVEKNCQVA